MSRTTRRDFAKVLAAFPLTLTTQEAPKPSPLAVALTGLVRAEFGRFLDDDEIQRVAKDFEDYAPYLENFRKFALKNSDAP